jgi:hypothetical protein
MLLKKLALISGFCSIIFAAQSTFAGSYTVHQCNVDVAQINKAIAKKGSFKTTNCPGINKAIINSKKNITLVTGKDKNTQQLCEATCYNGSDELACNWQPKHHKTLSCPPNPR